MWCKGTCDVFLIIKIIFLKEQFTQNPPMLMDSQVNFVSPQNISGNNLSSWELVFTTEKPQMNKYIT